MIYDPWSVSGAFALIFNSPTRFIIKGRMLEMAQMASLYLWHSSFYGRWWGMLAESTGNDCGVWKGGILSLLLLYINLRGYSEWKGDDMIFIWAMSQQLPAGDWSTSGWENEDGSQKNIWESKCSCLMVCLTCPWTFPGSDPPSSFCVEESRKLGDPALAAATVTTWS